MKDFMRKIGFIFGLLFGLALIVPLFVAFVDSFWFLVTGSTVWLAWSGERIMLLTLWSAVTVAVFAAATRK